jgi:hypothetical protein
MGQIETETQTDIQKNGWMGGWTDGRTDVWIMQIDISVTCTFLQQFTLQLHAVKKSELHLT